ncbi:hypothetical protein TI04_07570 [Achromatium sp. WMS2]|nr:hypothetical protein TI04_07570 [Achromatium sp. WMS2]
MLLDIQAIDVAYGQLQVLFGVDLHVYRGEIVAIIGPNGAGKSTLIKSVVGLSPAQAGKIRFLNHDITQLAAHKVPALGIGYVPQGRIVFANMTVEDNLELGAFLIQNRAAKLASVARVFDQFPRLAERRQQLAGKLSGGEQQMLAIGRALMLDPQLLILDEPSLGLAPKYVDMIFDILLQLRQQGRALLMVEQNAARALTIADRGYVLELGHNRFHDTGAALLTNPQVRKMYLGG